MAETPFQFQNVQIDTASPNRVGIGYKSLVYKAVCDGLPCAAKMLDPKVRDGTLHEGIKKQFDLLSRCQHPNIVQHLGMTTDSETGQPVLLVERMDSNLNDFLAQSRREGPLPRHVQVDLCHDIAKALNYLHLNGIIHCNLSSRNILLSGGKAKIDIPTSFILRQEPECPGKPNYMPPEAFGMQYTCKLDCFSFGVLAIEIITKENPEPGPRNKKEIERRKTHIDQIDPDNPLLPIVLECLKDNDTERPSSQELCRRLSALKESHQYSKSSRKGSTTQRQLEEKIKDLEEKIQELREQLAQAKSQQLAQENEELRERLAQANQELQERSQQLAQANQELQERSQQLVQANQELQERGQQLVQANQELQERGQQLAQANQELQERSQQLAQANQELQERGQQLAQANKELQERSQQLVQANQELQERGQQPAQANQELQERGQQLAQANQELLERSRHLAQANQEVQSLSRQLQQLRIAKPHLTSTDVEAWTVPRMEVEIRDQIGGGAWGAVAKGKFRNQQVAVKWPHTAIINTQTLERLKREVRIMAQIRHPNLLRFIAAVFDDQTPPLIITELLDMNLRTAYENGHLQRPNKLPIFRDVAYALHYLHEHEEPIIHRDVSAPNVLLEALPGGTWRAKVSDFGSANLARLSQTLGEGTIIYTAPETFPIIDPHVCPPPQTTKIDIYSYGILLCEVVTCQLPNPVNYHDMLQQVQREWQFMYDLIVSCTKHNPDERPTMLQVLDKLN